MSRWVVIVTLVMMGLVGSGTALALPGSGTQEDPWRIESLTDFNEFAADEGYWDDYTRLETDVNLAGRTYSTAVIAPDVDNSIVLVFDGTRFTGVFDGNDRKIINLTIDDGGSGNDFLGLFGLIDGGEVSNLGVEGGSITGQYCVGVLAGWNDGSFSNCYSAGDVTGCGNVGGLVGINGDESISNCYSAGDVSGIAVVGGLVGGNHGTISNCYSTGDVTGNSSVAGLVGTNWGDGSVSNCYSTGDVSGNASVAGLVGGNVGSISNCFWDTDTQTHGVTEGIGVNGGIATNVAGLPTSRLQQQPTFQDWDFINVWAVGENQTYPYLRTVCVADINKDGVVNFKDFAIIAAQWVETE